MAYNGQCLSSRATVWGTGDGGRNSLSDSPCLLTGRMTGVAGQGAEWSSPCLSTGGWWRSGDQGTEWTSPCFSTGDGGDRGPRGRVVLSVRNSLNIIPLDLWCVWRFPCFVGPVRATQNGNIFVMSRMYFSLSLYQWRGGTVKVIDKG